MRYTHAWGDTPWKELKLSDCSREAWNAPKGMEGFAMCDNGDELTLNYARYVGSHERKVLYFELDGVKFVPERTCTVESSFLNDFSSDHECWYEFDLSCGHHVQSGDMEPPKFCEECGAKVVDE